MSERLTWAIITPSGWRVPGMRGDDPAALKTKYASVMHLTWGALFDKGYRCHIIRVGAPDES